MCNVTSLNSRRTYGNYILANVHASLFSCTAISNQVVKQTKICPHRTNVVSCVYCIHTSSAVHSHIECLSNTIIRARIDWTIVCIGLNDTAVETRWYITRTSSTDEPNKLWASHQNNRGPLIRTIGLVAAPEPGAPGSIYISIGEVPETTAIDGHTTTACCQVSVAHYIIIHIVKLPHGQCTEVHIAVVGQSLSHEGEVRSRWSLRVDLHQRPEQEQQ